MRSKRRCVLEKKQPYSGDEWCSGPESEEEEEKPPSTTHSEFSHPQKQAVTLPVSITLSSQYLLKMLPE